MFTKAELTQIHAALLARRERLAWLMEHRGNAYTLEEMRAICAEHGEVQSAIDKLAESLYAW